MLDPTLSSFLILAGPECRFFINEFFIKKLECIMKPESLTKTSCMVDSHIEVVAVLIVASHPSDVEI